MIKKHGLIISFISVLFPFTLLPGCALSGPVPEEVISRAIEATGEVKSYRTETASFSDDEDNGFYYSEESEFVSPDRIHILPITSPTQSIPSELIKIGDMEYRRKLDSDDWVARRSPPAFNETHIAGRMVKMLESLENITKLPDEKVDGVDCFHFKSCVDAEAKADEILARLDPSEPGYEAQLKLIEWQRNKLEEYEFWIGKEDSLLRRMNAYIETSPFRSEGEKDEKEERRSAHNNFRFFDFNEPIVIETPVADYTEGVSLSMYTTNSVGGSDDRAHQQIKYEIRVQNRGIEIAKDLRIFIDTPATNQGLRTIEAEPEIRPENLTPGESKTYLADWEYDLTKSSKQELVQLLEKTVIRATWTDKDGREYEDVLLDSGLNQAKPYQVLGEGNIVNEKEDRTVGLWFIVSENAACFEEYAQTAIQAVRDLYRLHGRDYTSVHLIPNGKLKYAVSYAQAKYAADGKGALGMTGSAPAKENHWKVWVTDRTLTGQELAIAELWFEKMPDFPNKNLISSCSYDKDALREYIAETLGIPLTEVVFPKINYREYEYDERF